MTPAVACSRRQFIATTAAATAVLAAGRLSPAETMSQRYRIAVFSKPFQDLGPDETAEFVAGLGFDGIECPVRRRGQIEPDAVEEQLPRYVEALRRRNLDLPIVTTDIASADSTAQRVLQTASRLGIRHYRLASYRYDRNTPIHRQLEAWRSQLRELAALNRELGITGGYQNHSGADFVGAPVWDVYELIKDLDPKHLAVHFDISHATIEGGYCWPTHARLMEPFYSSVYCKDYVWRHSGRGWRHEWVPLGEGMLHRSFFDGLKQTAFAGPISQHFEYLNGSTPEVAAAMKRDLATLREWLR